MLLYLDAWRIDANSDVTILVDPLAKSFVLFARILFETLKDRSTWEKEKVSLAEIFLRSSPRTRTADVVGLYVREHCLRGKS